MRFTGARPARFLSLTLRWVLGLVFIVAGGLKVYEPAKFAIAVGNYRLLPPEMINLVAITLPWIEVTAALLLITGLWERASALVITVLCAGFFFAIASALARGLNIECGCFGTVGGKRVGLTGLAFDTVLLVMAAWLTWRASEEVKQT